MQIEYWTERVAGSSSILNRNEHQEKLVVTKERQESAQTIEFESVLKERIDELNLRLKESDNLRESDILINEIDTLESILGRLADLKYGEKARAIEIAESNNDFKQTIRLRKQLNKFQDLEDEISITMQLSRLNAFQLKMTAFTKVS